MKKKTKIHYDESSDVLYISFGEPQPSYAEDLADGIYIRYAFDTNEVTGITILDFSKRKDELKQFPWPNEINSDVNNYVI